MYLLTYLFTYKFYIHIILWCTKMSTFFITWNEILLPQNSLCINVFFQIRNAVVRRWSLLSLIKYNFQNIVANNWMFPFRYIQLNPTIINNKKDNLELNNFILELSVMAAKEKSLDLGTNVWPVLIMICASVVKLKESTRVTRWSEFLPQNQFGQDLTSIV